MKKLSAAYVKLNPKSTIEVLQSDSTEGIHGVIRGTVDIGMVSRNLTDSEKSSGIRATVIAIDGIAVIVNKANPVRKLSDDTVRKIYIGDITAWSIIK